MFSKILVAIDVASKYLQNEKAGLFLATYHFESALQTTTNISTKLTRSDSNCYSISNEAKQEAIGTASRWRVEVKFQDKRIKKRSASLMN